MKACKNCRRLVDKDVKECPYCGSKKFTEDWRGIVIIINPEKSKVAQALQLFEEGKYALKV